MGFIAAAWILNRIYLGAERSLIAPSERRQAPFVFEEVVKVLNLRDVTQRESSGPQEVTLTDYYRLTKESDQSSIVFHYATTGERMEGKCITHPLASSWVEKKKTDLGEDIHLGHEYEIRVDLHNLARGASEVVINTLHYFGAFEGEEREWLHTHIEKPTGRLVMVVMFPDHRPCRTIAGKTKTAREPFEELKENHPAILEDGRMVYWSIEAPYRGAEFQLEWEWDPPRITATPTASSESS